MRVLHVSRDDNSDLYIFHRGFFYFRNSFLFDKETYSAITMLINLNTQ